MVPDAPVRRQTFVPASDDDGMTRYVNVNININAGWPIRLRVPVLLPRVLALSVIVMWCDSLAVALKL